MYRFRSNDIYSDIAVLQILQNASQPQRQLLSSLKPLALGNSSNLEVGDQVIAIGKMLDLFREEIICQKLVQFLNDMTKWVKEGKVKRI